MGCCRSLDGRFYVTTSRDKTLKLWNAKTGSCIFTVHVPELPSRCMFSNDGTRIVAGSNDSSVFVWELEDARTQS